MGGGGLTKLWYALHQIGYIVLRLNLLVLSTIALYSTVEMDWIVSLSQAPILLAQQRSAG
jgi:hypothetical protein